MEPVPAPARAGSSPLVLSPERVGAADQPELGPVRLLGVPIKLSRTEGDPTRPAPALGEHTEAILSEAGFTEQEVAELLESGAAAGPNREPTEARFMG